MHIMANAWITFVKMYASKHGISYVSALGDPKCKAEYYKSKPSKPSKPSKRMVSPSKMKSMGSSSTSTEVRSPTSTATSTKADTKGNITVTGGAGKGATTSVTINQRGKKKSMM